MGEENEKEEVFFKFTEFDLKVMLQDVSKELYFYRMKVTIVGNL